MTDKDQALERAIKQEADTALAHLVFDDRLKAAVRQKIAQIEALPSVPATRTPGRRHWQPYAWGTLAAAAVTGVFLLNSYRTGTLPGQAAGSAPAPTARPMASAANPSGAAAMQAQGTAPGAGGGAVELGAQSDAGSPAPPTTTAPAIGSQQPQTVAAIRPDPVTVEITPTAGSVPAGQPLTFTIKVTSATDSAATLASTPPRLVVKSTGIRNQITSQVPVPDLAGKPLAARGATASARVVWTGATVPGYYSVSLEGLSVAMGQESANLSQSGQQVLVRFTDDPLTRSFSPNKATTARDITVTVQRIDASAQVTRVSFRFDGVPGTVNDPTITLQRDGQEILVPLRIEQTQIPGGVVLTAEFNPLPASTKNLSFTVADVQVPASGGGFTTVPGPWQITVNP